MARQLKTLRRENEKDLEQKQKIWENKFREVQKEKHTLSVRLQKLEMESPRQRLAQEGDVHLTEEDLKLLRQEIEEQESLIRGYQIENERAVERLRAIQIDAKEKERMLEEQNTALASQLACFRASGGLKLSKEEAYASLTESLTLRAEILNAQAREAALMSEFDKIKNEKKVLENKIADFEKMKTQKKHTGDAFLDASCQCTMLTDHSSEALSNLCEFNERAGNVECYEGQNLENRGDKQNFVHCDYTLQAQLGEEEKKVQSLQKRIERMKRAYDLKIKDLKQQIEKMPMPPQDMGKASTRRVKELEAQINDIRSFYTKKLKEVSGKADTSSMKKHDGRVNTDTTKIGKMSKLSVALKDSQKRVASLEEILKEKTAIIKHLEANFLSTIPKQGSEEESCAGNLSSVTCQEISPKEEAYPTFLENASFDKVQPCVRHDTSDAYQTQTGKVGTVADISLSKGQNQVSGKGFNDIAQTASYMYQPQETQKKFNFDAAYFEQQVEIENCRAKGNQYNNIPEPRHEAVGDKVNVVQKTAIAAVDQRQQLEVLQEKVLEMESRQKHRELEWQALLIDTKRLLNIEHDLAERKWGLAMEAKNAEIDRFKLELDTILETAIELQRAQLNIS